MCRSVFGVTLVIRLRGHRVRRRRGGTIEQNAVFETHQRRERGTMAREAVRHTELRMVRLGSVTRRISPEKRSKLKKAEYHHVKRHFHSCCCGNYARCKRGNFCSIIDLYITFMRQSSAFNFNLSKFPVSIEDRVSSFGRKVSARCPSRSACSSPRWTGPSHGSDWVIGHPAGRSISPSAPPFARRGPPILDRLRSEAMPSARVCTTLSSAGTYAAAPARAWLAWMPVRPNEAASEQVGRHTFPGLDDPYLRARAWHDLGASRGVGRFAPAAAPREPCMAGRS